jgi:hypothetical protein
VGRYFAATVVYFYAGQWWVFTPALTNILLDKVTRPEAIDIFRSLIERVEINPGKERAPVTLSSLAHLPPYLPSWNKKQPPPLEETTVRS